MNLRFMFLVEHSSLILFISTSPTIPCSLLVDACDCNSSSAAIGITTSSPVEISPDSNILVTSPLIIILVSKT